MSWKKSDTGPAVSPVGNGSEASPSSIRSEGMDAEQIRAHMQEAEQRAAEAELIANRQRALVGTLVRNGKDAAEARRLLGILEQRLALEEAERDCMRRELLALRRREG